MIKVQEWKVPVLSKQSRLSRQIYCRVQHGLGQRTFIQHVSNMAVAWTVAEISHELQDHIITPCTAALMKDSSY